MTYAKGLALFEYELVKVESGQYDESTIYVYHWTLMDKTVLPIATRKVGEVYTLTLEPFDAHTELVNECQTNTLDAEDVELDHTLYYDIAR